MILYYDMDGQPIQDASEWSRLFESESRILGRTELPGGVQVSTVWLGMDMSFTDEGPPLIFESMVFGPESSTDLDCRRYATRQEAEDGHSELVTRWTGWTPGDGYPDGAEASFLSQFITALEVQSGARPYTEAESFMSDQMVVMYPKEDEVADRLASNEDPLEGE